MRDYGYKNYPTALTQLERSSTPRIITSAITGEVVAELFYDEISSRYAIAFERCALFNYGRGALVAAMKKAGYDRKFLISNTIC